MKEKILQFGGGNFIRAFVDWMVDILNEASDFDGSVIVVKPTERGDYIFLKKQNGLFHVVLTGIKEGKNIEQIRAVKCISSVLHAYRQWNDFLARAELSDLRFVISNTTEAGIVFNKKEQFLWEKTPHEFPAKLCIWLYRRFLSFNGAIDKGCIFLPLELIPNNADTLRGCLLQYAAHWNLPKEFSQWIQQYNYFCNTLVDRIVSGFPKTDARRIQKEIGFVDELLVAGEIYHSWIIQAPDFVQKELPFSQTNLNVKFVKNLAIHRQIKVRILNGAHTAMVCVGLLAKIEFVSEAMADPFVSRFIEEMISEEIIPCIAHPKADLLAYAKAVLNRFRNPSIQHQLLSIALNTTSKFKTRLLPTLNAHLQKEGRLPKRIVFALAALIRLYKGDIVELNDSQQTLDFFIKTWRNYGTDNKKLVHMILKQKEIWGTDLTQINGLARLVTTHLKLILKKENHLPF